MPVAPGGPRARRRRPAVGRAALAAVLGAALLVGCPSPPPESCDGATVEQHDVPYRAISGVDPGRLSLDVYRPGADCRHAGVLVWVHGGGFATGDKANQMPHKVALANERGMPSSASTTG